MATIRLQNVTMKFSKGRDEGTAHGNQVTALDDVNLVIPNGQTVAIVGPSGCGKSSLLRTVAGLEMGYQGEIFFDTQSMNDVPPSDREVGMVFQNYALYPHFKGHGNLSFFFRVRKAPDKEAEERIRITSEIMGIGFKELLRRKPGTLSGGQQQRVAIARAIVRQPRLFLFDEPLSNLDAKLRTRTRVEIKRLLKQFGITAIYVTHDQTEAIALGDQIVVMNAGQIEQMGTFHALRDYPVNTFVAGFLGNPPMNLLRGGVIDAHTIRINSARFQLPESIVRHLKTKPRLQLVVGIRPEVTRIIPDVPPFDGPYLRGTVEVIEPDFANQTQLVYLRSGDFTFAATGHLDMALSLGNEAVAELPVDQLYFFDAEHGRRIGID